MCTNLSIFSTENSNTFAISARAMEYEIDMNTHVNVVLQVYGSTNGVMTNSPDYNWQLNNLTNYVIKPVR